MSDAGFRAAEVAWDIADLRAAVDAAAAALNARVAATYPLGVMLSVAHKGTPMRATVVRHPDGCYHAGELLVRSRGGGQQWIRVERIIQIEVPVVTKPQENET